MPSWRSTYYGNGRQLVPAGGAPRPQPALCHHRSANPSDRALGNVTRNGGRRFSAGPLPRPSNTAIRTVGVTLTRLARRVHEELGVDVSCRASNIFFGLPERAALNTTFLAIAVASGVAAAIVNPLDEGLRKTALAADVLTGPDEGSRTWLRVLYKEAPCRHRPTALQDARGTEPFPEGDNFGSRRAIDTLCGPILMPSCNGPAGTREIPAAGRRKLESSPPASWPVDSNQACRPKGLVLGTRNLESKCPRSLVWKLVDNCEISDTLFP